MMRLISPITQKKMFMLEAGAIIKYPYASSKDLTSIKKVKEVY